MLTGERPFAGNSWEELAERIKAQEVCPPRQLNPAIPQELERICLKALSKRAVDRYATAGDLAEDLRLFAQGEQPNEATVEPCNIFISYRRDDADLFAGRLCDHLRSRFGDQAVFLDVASTRYGADFPQQINERLIHSDVVLVVIGPKWLEAGEAGQRRIDQPRDFVRLEVETALSGKVPKLIPVLVGSTPMPKAGTLPESIRKLAELNACRIDTGADFALHVDRLIEDVREASDSTRQFFRPNKRSKLQQSSKIIPKGLRPFDAGDADFFLELLPGPRDRDGLPESIRFWKTRIEETDADETFRVGLIYGSSGCGKSSLIQAGLLPRLADHVTPVSIEATADGTEPRLLKALQKKCPSVSEDANLIDVMVELRRGRELPAGQKIVIVIDQFEQWLHARQGAENTELIQALRHCDGSRVQCIVTVRDDFWLAVSRFMQELEIRIVEAENSRLVDLFDLRHARTVLQRFGTALGTLPSEDQTRDAFLERAVAGLAEEGKVVCVRLALLADMLKGKTWSVTALEQAGGTEGLGAAFLEDTFGASTAPPAHRLHQKAARAVLKALLSESGTQIKGRMQSYDQLLAASGYATQPQEFQQLIDILDGELRLITPTDPEGQPDEGGLVQIDAGQKYYQLTHDYLVPSLRAWLTRKQQETRRGRAELRLAERAAQWKTKPENRHLPAWWEYLIIRCWTGRSDWTDVQRKMMRTAGRVHGRRWGAAILSVLIIGFLVEQTISRERRANLLQRVEGQVAVLGRTRGVLVPRAIEDLKELPRTMVVTELQQAYSDSSSVERLSLAYALAETGDLPVDFLVAQIEHVGPPEVENLVTALAFHRGPALEKLKAAAAACHNQEAWVEKARCAIVAMHLGELSLAGRHARPSRSTGPNSAHAVHRDILCLAWRFAGLGDLFCEVGWPAAVIGRRMPSRGVR